MIITGELWDQLHDLFDTNDGSLPDIELNNLTGPEVANVYAYLRSQSKITSDALCYWSRTAQKDVLVDSVENAAQLVVNGEAEAFHIVVAGLSYGGTVVPDLGIFVSVDFIGLDYRMGPEWGPAELEAFFACLFEIQQLAPLVEITMPGVLDYWRERFALALKRYFIDNRDLLWLPS